MSLFGEPVSESAVELNGEVVLTEAEEVQLMTALLVESLQGASEEEMDEFIAEAMSEVGNLTAVEEASIVKLDKKAKFSQLVSVAKIQIIKKKFPKKFKQLQRLWAMEKSIMSLADNMESQAQAIARQMQRKAKASKSKHVAKASERKPALIASSKGKM